jgi:hypothetical protein
MKLIKNVVSRIHTWFGRNKWEWNWYARPRIKAMEDAADADQRELSKISERVERDFGKKGLELLRALWSHNWNFSYIPKGVDEFQKGLEEGRKIQEMVLGLGIPSAQTIWNLAERETVPEAWTLEWFMERDFSEIEEYFGDPSYLDADTDYLRDDEEGRDSKRTLLP